MRQIKILLLALALPLVLSNIAVAVIDVVQAPTGFFVPDDSLKYSSPYYRDMNQDWGWTHGAIAGTITSAKLQISAFDVDNAGPANQWEHDLIFGWDTDTAAWISIPPGVLAGADDTWSYTDFTVPASLFNEVSAGLQVWMDIDTTSGGSWLVTLAKSVLTTEGEEPPPPQPGVPEPMTMVIWSLLGALGLVYGWRHRKR
ncbi:MAG: hypothetical protein IT426_02320 [Pirellulales bacterium]|nr:hypothetical protein [Pirellulales bacterium]